jgi:hypothetical protein
MTAYRDGGRVHLTGIRTRPALTRVRQSGDGGDLGVFSELGHEFEPVSDGERQTVRPPLAPDVPRGRHVHRDAVRKGIGTTGTAYACG